jgi:hypothetical protein
LECHLLFLDIRFSEAEISRLYKDYRGYEYTALRDRYEPGYSTLNEGLTQGINYLDAIETFLAPYLPETITLLDWGGDTGVNTPFKRGDRNSIHVYDISGADTTGKIRKVSRQTAADSRYDLIVCSNVLEHVPYPKQLLEDVRSAMQASTVLYIEVPRENLVRDNPDPSILLTKKRHWHEHVNFFSERALMALLRSAKLTVLGFHLREIFSEGKLHSHFMIACTKSESA